MTLQHTQVWLDPAGTGTFTSDISAYVRSVSWSGGQQDEMSSVEPGQAQIVLDNTDGLFTLGGASVIAGFGMSMPIRITAGPVAKPMWTGYIDAAPITWTSDNGLASQVTVTASDALARMQRRTLRSMLEQEVLLDSPRAYWTLADGSDATSASESSGNNQSPLQITGTGAAVVFGSGTGPGGDGLTAATFASGQYLRAPVTFNGTTLFYLAAELWFNTTAVPTSPMTMLSVIGHGNASLIEIQLSTTGKVIANVAGAAAQLSSLTALNDGHTHHIAVATSTPLPSGDQAILYVDGGVGDDTSTVASLMSPVAVAVGGHYPYAPFTGTIAHAAVYDTALTWTRITERDLATRPERSDARMARLLSYGGYQLGTTGTYSLTDVPVQATSGTDLLSACQQVATAEGGLFWLGPDGYPEFRGRSFVWPGVDLHNAPLDVGSDLTFANDKQLLYNQVTAQRYTPDGSAPTITVTDDASVATHGPYQDTSLSGVLVSTDAEAADVANWRLSTHSQPSTMRVSQITYDLLAGDDGSLIANSIGIGSKITTAALPAQAPTTGTPTFLIVGASGSAAVDELSLTFNTVEIGLYGQGTTWRLGVIGKSELGSTTRLYY